MPIITVVARHQGVRFINKQHTTTGLVDDFFDFQRGLANIPTDEICSRGFDERKMRQNVHRSIKLCHKARNRRFAGAWRSSKHQMLAENGLNTT